MATGKFKSFETDGEGQPIMPHSITIQVLVKPVPQPNGVTLLLSSAPSAETGQPVETQWYLTKAKAKWLADHLQQALADAADARQPRPRRHPRASVLEMVKHLWHRHRRAATQSPL